MVSNTTKNKVLTDEEFVDGYRFITQFISEGVPFKFVLVQALKFFEEKMKDTYSTMMILNNKGTEFVDSIAYSLPSDSLKELMKLDVNDGLGTCGAAVVSKELIILEDLDTEPTWEQHNNVLRKLGLSSSWAVPIFSPSNKQVVAVLAMYSKKAKRPSSKELEIVFSYHQLISLIISNYRQTEIDFKTLDNDASYFDTRDLVKSSDYTTNQFILSIKNGINLGEFIPYYQPIIYGGNKEIYGVEALARWKHPEEGIVSPYYFIGAAERYGLIQKLDEAVSYQAMKDMSKIIKEIGRPIVLSINVSAHHISKDNYVSRMEYLLNKANFDPKNLSIEITETSLIENLDGVVMNIVQLKNLGIRILIDDFGTNYSSLNYLKHLPVDMIKLDQTFIQDILESQVDQKICQTIIQLAKDLNLDVVAEGIEKQEHLEIIEGYGCEIFQGFFFSKPMSKDDWKKYLTKKIN